MMNIYSFTDEPTPFTMDDLNDLVYEYMERATPLLENNKYTIYIPSKGRARTNKASRTLTGLNYKLVVEPQDYDEYCSTYSSDCVIQLDKNNQGLAYARNFIKQYSQNIGEEYHWQIDDDIEVFKFRKKDRDRNEKVNAIFALSIVEHCTDMFTNVAVSGINSDTFAFSRSKAVQKNKLTCQCVLVNNSFDIDWAYGGVEDWHYTLLSLEKGYCTLAFDHIMTTSPPPGKQPGGNTNTHYSDNILKPMLQEFVTVWQGRFNIKEEPLSQKKWRLKPARKFFSDYKQNLILKNNVPTIL